MLVEKVIVVTGGAGLLGSTFCEAISEHSGLAIVADLNLEAAEQVANRIKAMGGRAEAAILDITDTDSVNRLIESIHDQHGHIDAVVNNAYPRNKNWGRKLEDVVYSDFCDNVNLHLGGYFLVAQRFSLYFCAHGGGNIVNMASIYGCKAPRFEIYAGTTMTTPVEYAAIKSAVIHLTQYFAQYFKNSGVRCNTLSPGGILDGQPESFLDRYKTYCGTKGMLEVNDIVGTLLFLLSDNSKFITGQNLVVDDGFTL